MAAGVLNTFRATGLALGIALMGAVLAASGGGAGERPTAFVDGFSTPVTINSLIAVAAAIVAALTLGARPREQRPSPAGQSKPTQPSTAGAR